MSPGEQVGKVNESASRGSESEPDLAVPMSERDLIINSLNQNTYTIEQILANLSDSDPELYAYCYEHIFASALEVEEVGLHIPEPKPLYEQEDSEVEVVAIGEPEETPALALALAGNCTAAEAFELGRNNPQFLTFTSEEQLVGLLDILTSAVDLAKSTEPYTGPEPFAAELEANLEKLSGYFFK